MRTIVTVAVLVACALAPAWAQDPAKQTTKATEGPAPALKPGTFTLPPSALDTSGFRYDPPTDSKGFGLPKVDLGQSTLQFDASRKEPANRVGIEALTPSQLGDIQKQQSTVLPNYLGLKLSKPLN
jgi:hypothetical protein